MKFASINLNGNTIYNLKNIKGNISPELTDIISTLNDTLDEKVMEKLIDRLTSYRYDIIAAQEVLNEDVVKNKILGKGYKIYPTENLSKSTRFFSAFLVKENLIIDNSFTIENMNLDLTGYKNRFVEILVKDNETGMKLKLLNVHNPGADKRATFKKIMKKLDPNEEDIILLGDFNAANESQRNNESKKKTTKKVIDENNDFLDQIVQIGFVAMGKASDFTYKTVEGLENKIDHVFFSNSLLKRLDLDITKKDILEDMVNIIKEVNYMEDYNNKKGITDHSMLEFEINL